MLHANEINILKHISSSLRFFLFWVSCIIIAWSGLVLDKTFPLARGINFYKNLTAFSANPADFCPKII